MTGRRLDLDPEPEEATDVHPEQQGVVQHGWSAGQASFARFQQHLIVRVPAAGRLGVQEIQCPGAHTWEDGYAWIPGDFVCPLCKAQV